jgi:hypothetical protein
MTTPSARELLLSILAQFPQADPDSEDYDTGIDGCNAVDFICDLVPRIKECLANIPQTTTPNVAIILHKGLVDAVIVDQPDLLPPLNLMVLDYDTEGADEEEITLVPQSDGKEVEAYVRMEEITPAGINLGEVHSRLLSCS